MKHDAAPMTVLRRVLLVRGLRGVADGCVSLVLPFYLTALGFTPLQVGIIATATMLGSGIVSIAVGFIEHRHGARALLLFAALLMAATGAGFVLWTDFWPLLVIALVGTLNPSNGDISLFLPLEHATIASNTRAEQRTAAFARYSLVGSLAGSVGALSAGLPQWMAAYSGLNSLDAMRAIFAAYGLAGFAAWAIYRGLPRRPAQPPASHAPLDHSRATVLRLMALFSLDSLGSGFVAQSMLALWLHQRHGLPLDAAGLFFFWVGLASAASFPVAVVLARRIGAVRTMVFTHVPASLLLMLVPFMPSLWPALALLLVRALIGAMDAPVRSAFVMNSVAEHERAAAASVTTAPKSLAAALGPGIAGWMLSLSAFGWPLIVAGGVKLLYDALLYRLFSRSEATAERNG